MKPVEELHQIIQMMILDSYGLVGNSDSIMECEILLRMMRYKAPSTEEYMNGLSAHTDKLMCTLLVEEEVSGLEIETRDGQWIKLSLSPSSLVFIVGDPLMVTCPGPSYSSSTTSTYILLSLWHCHGFCFSGMEQWKIACSES